jgi:1-acyl-sn-glycerol-3-phosphate acyltransferase
MTMLRPMTMLRSGLFNLYFFGVTFMLCLVGTPVAVLAPHRVLGFTMFWARMVVGGVRVICGIRLEVSGREWLPTGGAALIASVHQSAYDTMVWLTLLPGCCYVQKQELASIPLFGLLSRKAGMISVDRAAGVQSLRHLLREADRAVREARQIVIFPEGTRGAPGQLLTLQPGVAALAARTGLPVIPVVTDSGLCWGRRAFHKRPGVIHIRIHPPIEAGTARGTLMGRLDSVFRSEIGASTGDVDKSVDRTIRDQ